MCLETHEKRLGEIFGRIRELADQAADVDLFVEPIRELSSIMTVAIGSVIDPGKRLYRATKHHFEVPRHISEISNPPASRITTLGRCNRMGHSIFYCSSDQNCAVEEINPVAGDLVVRATWEITERMPLQDIGYTSDVLARAGASRPLPDRYRKFIDSLSDEARVIRGHIASAFTDRSEKSYPLTAAIAEDHLRSDDVVGIMYPSFTRKANADNFALQPSFVSKGLKLIAAEAMRVRDWNDTARQAYRIADLEQVDLDGSLVWVYSVAEKVKSSKEGTRVRIKPGRKLTVKNDSDVLLNGRRYRLRAGFTVQLEGEVITVRDANGVLVQPQ